MDIKHLDFVTLPGSGLFQIFKDAGFEIRIVGGSVRDLLLGVVPKDVDFATPALPREISEILRNADLPVITLNERHGTVATRIYDHTVEITTLRMDVKTDGRHADVEFITDWQADAARRDFTVNAMMLDAEGKLYDYFDGRKHLEEQRVVFVGGPRERIQEDYLRILRYFRFRARLDDTNVDPEAFDAIRDNAPRLAQISGERKWMEMKKILPGTNAMNQIIVMDDLGIFQAMDIPETDRYRLLAARICTKNPVTLLAALLTTVATAEKIAKDWNLSGGERNLLIWLSQFRSHQLVIPKIAVDKGKHFALELAAVQGLHVLYDHIAQWDVPNFPILGRDLIKLGMPPGPGMGEELARLRDLWVSNHRLSRDELLKQVSLN